MDVLTYLMDRSRSATTMLTMLAVMSLLNGCNRPISDANKLEAIRAGAQALMKKYPAERPKNWRKISKGKWPAAIADLYPEDVTVHTWGVDITTKAYFDGGYGYDVPVSKANLPMPAACYSEPSRGVFWHGPC